MIHTEKYLWISVEFNANTEYLFEEKLICGEINMYLRNTIGDFELCHTRASEEPGASES